MDGASSHASVKPTSSAPPGRRELIAIALIVIMGVSASALLINARVKLQDFGNTLHSYHAEAVEVIRYIRYLIDSNAKGWSNDPITEFITERIREGIKSADALSLKAQHELGGLSHPLARTMTSLSPADITFLRNDTDIQKVLALARTIVEVQTHEVPGILGSVDPNLSAAITYGDALTEFRYRIARVEDLSNRSRGPLLTLLVGIGSAVLLGILVVWFRALRPAILQLQRTNQALAETGQALKEQNIALERNELESRAAQRVAKFGYWIADKDGQISGSEGLAHILGMKAEKLPRTLAELATIGSPRSPLSQTPDSDILSGYLPLQNEAGAREFMRVIEDKGGKERIIRERVESLSEPRTGSRYMIGIMIDVSELAEAQARIARTEKLDSIGVLTGFIAHDVNNVLAIIRGSIDLLEVSPNSLKSRLEAMRRAVDSAASLINRLSLLSKGEPEEEELFDPRHSLKSCVELFQSNAFTSVKVELDLGNEQSSLVRMNRGQFDNAVLNLLINAREALEGKSDGLISLKCRTVIDPQIQARDELLMNGQFFCIEISDNGCGMSADALRRSFDPFYSTKKHHTARPRGLGLWSAYQLFKNSGGDLAIVSKENRGTTVTMHLPIHMRDLSLNEVTAPNAKILNGRINAEVLIVDDQRDLLEVLDQQLNLIGYSTWTATNITDAVDILKKRPEIDLIISDINLRHGETGLQLAHHIRKSDKEKAILFISGYLSAEQSNGDFQDIAVVRKPIDLNVLDAEMQSALHNAKTMASQMEQTTQSPDTKHPSSDTRSI